MIQPWEFGAIPHEWVGPIERNVDEVWVPSEYVRRMYVDGGVDPERVAVVPNGVDLELFRPDGPRHGAGRPRGTRFLFVGGLIERKGPDLLLAAYLEAFAGRDDVCLVIKDFGADTIYPGSDRRPVSTPRRGALPRIDYLHDDLTDEEMAALYRACDVMVLPYRGEGFCMPALEAMACGLPVIVTAGGPTDEFVPDEACWRVPAGVRPVNRVAEWTAWSTPGSRSSWRPTWRRCAIMLEAAATPAGRAGAARPACRRAGLRMGRDRAAAYRERIAGWRRRPPRPAVPPGGRRSSTGAPRRRCWHAGLAGRRPARRAARGLGTATSPGERMPLPAGRPAVRRRRGGVAPSA